MSKSLLSVVQTVCRELGLSAPVSVAGSSDSQIIQLVALANDAGNDLMKEHDWTCLRYAYSFTTISGTSLYEVATVTLTLSGVTADRVINETGWDRTNHRPFKGALQDQFFDQLQYSQVSTATIGYAFRVAPFTNTVAPSVMLELYPTPTSSGTNLSVEFITNLWALHPVSYGSFGVNTAILPYASAMALDTDSHPFDERLFKLALKWRMLRAKGLAYDEERDQYQRVLALCKAQMGPARTLSLSRGRRGARLIDYGNVPETGFGGV